MIRTNLLLCPLHVGNSSSLYTLPSCSIWQHGMESIMDNNVEVEPQHRVSASAPPLNNYENFGKTPFTSSDFSSTVKWGESFSPIFISTGRFQWESVFENACLQIVKGKWKDPDTQGQVSVWVHLDQTLPLLQGLMTCFQVFTS